MSLVYILKSKLYFILLVILILSSYFLLSKKSRVIYTESSYFNRFTTSSFTRLNPHRRQLLSSALAHIRLGYTANRTPYYSTPPLLVVYSCKEDVKCGTLDERLIDITNSYFFSMLQQGSAFANDMTYPVKFEWFFEALPTHMSMNSAQAEYYLAKADNASIKKETPINSSDLQTKPFMNTYQSEGIRIVFPSWQGHWMDMKANPSMKFLRDKYRLNHISLKSDWFWLSSRLLFSKPASGWFLSQLEPYRELMGGKLQSGEGLSSYDPDNSISPSTPSEWFRMGIRIAKTGTEEDADCLSAHAVNVCAEATSGNKTHHKTCHIFLSAPTAELNEKLVVSMNQQRLKSQTTIIIHTINKKYQYSDLDIPPTQSEGFALFESEESKLKYQYARTFMEWIILSRMEYLIGQRNDGFLKTAAWAAQAQTDVKINSNNITCRIVPLSDW